MLKSRKYPLFHVQGEQSLHLHRSRETKDLTERRPCLRRPSSVNDINSDEDYLLTFSNTESEIIVPVFAENSETVAGTIDAESETKNAFSKEDAAFLEDCAKEIRSLWQTSNN
jgi:GAF domain-containing protein